MMRSLAVLAGLLTSLPAVAGDDAGVCILQVSETFTRPSKPNIFTTKMDCGSEPNRDQAQALIAVSSMPNPVDAVAHMVNNGFHIGAATSLLARSGGARYHFYTFMQRPEPVRANVGPAAPAADMPEPAPVDDASESLDDLDDELNLD